MVRKQITANNISQKLWAQSNIVNVNGFHSLYLRQESNTVGLFGS